MYSRIVVLVFLVTLGVIPLSSCKSEALITGEVFIVTQAGLSIKLGLVDVMAFAEVDAQKYLDEKNKEVITKGEQLKKEYDSAKAKYEDINKRYLQKKEADRMFEAASSRLANALVSAKSIEDLHGTAVKAADQDAQYWKQRKEELTSSSPTEEQETDAEQQKREAEKKLNEWPTNEFFYLDLPKDKVITKVTTDADGKFTLKLINSKKYLIVAKAQRNVISSTENYYWFCWLSSDIESKHIMLSNNNILGTNAAEVAIKPTSIEKH